MKMRAVLGLAFILLGATPCFAVNAGDVDRVVRPTCNCIDGVSVGDPNDKSTWSIQFKADATDAQKAAAQAALATVDPTAPSVPASVPQVQAKIVLYRHGLLDQVKTAVAANPELQIWFENAQAWERNNTYVTTLATQLGLTSAQLDALFVEAAQVK